ncbi:MAG: 3-dehydroquinate synthase [Candidatus Nanopelagicales bacterium]
MSINKVTVQAEHDYEVIVGLQVLGELKNSIASSVEKIAVIYPKDLAKQVRSVMELIKDLPVVVVPIEVENAEAAKTYQSAQHCWEILGEHQFTRSDLIIGFGGGATTDLAGFIAATWLRGISAILIPTSLLAMVDAAVGGKTGINTESGKNLVGVFSSPKLVICDLEFLTSLPKPDLAAGLAEVIKCGFIQDQSILEIFENEFDLNKDLDLEILQTLIVKAISTKAQVVGSDFKETSNSNLGREILNYGHTLGHAIEKLENYTWRHGDAIAVGMVFAAELSHEAGILSTAEVEKHRNLLSKLNLPTTYQGHGLTELLSVMSIDKKARGKKLRFVVLEKIGRPTRLEAPSEELLDRAWQKVSK